MPRPKSRGRGEPVPAWISEYVPADWQEPDAFAVSMGDIGGDARCWHAERRWLTARNRWLDGHPEHDHRLQELFDVLADEL